MNHIALSLRDIFFNKRTGRLVFKRDDTQKYFFFRKGALIQVKTNRPEERLGEVLFKLERISKDAHDQMDDYIEPNQNIGEVLKSRGVVSEQDINDALTYQLRETTLNTFPYFDADISFQEREDFSADAGEPKISVPFLIEYGIRRMQPDHILKSFLGGKTPLLKKKSYAYLLTSEETEILEKISGTETTDSILRTITAPPDFFWKSLYLFYCLDLVDFTAEAKEPARPARDQDKAPAGEPGPEAPPSISEVLAFRETVAAKTFYQILDVPKNASEDDVKKAYFQMARRFHPDKFDRKAAAEYKGQIDEVFDAITNAYRVLSNKERRSAYDAGTGPGVAAHEDFQELVKKADVKFRQGKTLYSMDRFDEAISLLEEAVRIRRDKADYYLLLGMAESKVPSYVRKAERDFLRAIELEPWNPEGYVGLGILYKNEGLTTKAVKQFERALEVDPDHAKAREAYDELNEGKKPRGLRGLMRADLFGSKKKKK
jgi:tetratricopeptide (TPR) repeat protein